MNQHCRIYMNSLGEITHVHTQTTPLEAGREPVTVEPPSDPTPGELLEWQTKRKTEHIWDLELSDPDPAKPEGFMRAREMIDNMEPTGLDTPPRFKPGAKRKPNIENSIKRK